MSKSIDQEREVLISEVLGRYLRDLRLRTFPDNDEGDYNLRWTAGEIKRAEKAIAACRTSVQALEDCINELNKYQHTAHPEGSDGARDYLVLLMHARHALAAHRTQQGE